MRALLNCREYNDYQIAQYTYNLLLDPLSVVHFLESADTQISATYPIVANIHSRNKDRKGIKYLRWDYTLKAILSHRAPSNIRYNQNQNRVTKPSL